METNNLPTVTDEDFIFESEKKEESEKINQDADSSSIPNANNKDIPGWMWIGGIFILCLTFIIGYLGGELQKDKKALNEIRQNLGIQQSQVVDGTVETMAVPTNSVEQIVEDTMPSLVSINTTCLITEYYFFFGPETYEVEGAGSGFIIKIDNNEIAILTNAHVVNDSKTISVTFNNGKTYNAILKSIDNKTDLALVSVRTSELDLETRTAIKCVKLGDSNQLKLGQSVIAIGNCLGYGQTVTTGVVSAVNRSITDDLDNTRTLIQTDAAINAGNSGGVLLDMAGRVIGINEAKIADIGVDGVGFAIPITDALKTIDMLSVVEPTFPVEESKRGKLGIVCVTVDQESSELYGMPQGVMIREVAEGECAYDAGLRENDIIFKIDKTKVLTIDDLSNVLKYKEIGEEIKITYARNTTGKWETSTVDVKLTAWVDEPEN